MKTDRSEVVSEVRNALDRVGIPHHTGLLAGRRPQVVFSVPREHLDRARSAVAASPAMGEALPARFPWREVQAVAALVAVHVAIVMGLAASGSPSRILRAGGLLKGATLGEPWRLLSSLLLHVDLSHVFWNSASMMVFAVPLLTDLRYARTGLIYVAAGVGGGLTALGFADPGTTIVGSSGAVAGLFGAWVVLALRKARQAELTRRAHIRTLGIALLVLPSLISPITSSGHSVSVSSHIGGLATGMIIGASISSRMSPRRKPPDPVGARFS